MSTFARAATSFAVAVVVHAALAAAAGSVVAAVLAPLGA
jgi:hypothetical protein